MTLPERYSKEEMNQIFGPDIKKDESAPSFKNVSNRSPNYIGTFKNNPETIRSVKQSQPSGTQFRVRGSRKGYHPGAGLYLTESERKRLDLPLSQNPPHVAIYRKNLQSQIKSFIQKNTEK